MQPKEIEFLRSKNYLLVKHIGRGGLGRTVLLKDEVINEYFVCKKYIPLNETDKYLYFENFKTEIKLLHRLYHKNVVRVFYYFLYPEKYTGYIIMEYINGTNISEYVKANPEKVNDIFLQVIEGFFYLEQNEILHRDLRPDNILVDTAGNVKIIDFGFGKKMETDDNSEKSISLNWRYSQPSDFQENIYDFRTEVYFVGKMFEEIILENRLQDFTYKVLLSRMTTVSRKERIDSYFDIIRSMDSKEFVEIEFTEEEKLSYIRFANQLQSIFSKIETSTQYISDLDLILKELEEMYTNSILEDIVQNNVTLARCFLKGDYKYFNTKSVYVGDLKSFIKFLKSLDKTKRRIVMNNVWQRLDKIPRYITDVDDLPF